MAKLRSVNTKFWEDSWVEELSPLHKLLFLHLITNPSANIAGIYEISIKRMCFDTGIDKETIKKGLEIFQTVGKVFYIDGFIFLPNWLKNQKMNENMKIGVMKIFHELPTKIQTAIFGNACASIFNINQTLSNGYITLSNTLLKYEVEDEREKETETEDVFVVNDFSQKPIIKLQTQEPIQKSTPKDAETVKSIMEYFDFNEINHFRQFADINAFVNLLISDKQIDFFKAQFIAYQKFKTLSKQKKQHYDTFLNGGWSKMNWQTELKNIENEQSISTETEDPNAELKRRLRNGKATTTSN